MDFSGKSYGELVALSSGDTSGWTDADWIDFGKALDTAQAKPTAATQASPMAEWVEFQDSQGNRYLQDPKYPSNIRPVTASRDEDPADKQWKFNLDRLEQQARINNLTAPEKPKEYDPTISTTAKQIWGKLPDGTMGWVSNPNFKEPVPAQGRKPLSETLAEIEATANARVEADLQFIAEQVAMGYIELPEAKRQADLLKEQTFAQTQGDIAKALAQEQSRLRDEEAAAFFERDRPFKEGQLDVQRGNLDVQRGNLDVSRGNLDVSRGQLDVQRGQAEQARRQAQATLLGKQAEQGQGMVNSLVQGGIAPSMASVRAAWSPLQAALKILNAPMGQAATDTALAAPAPTAAPGLAAPLPR